MHAQKLRLMKPRWAFGLTFVAAVLVSGSIFYSLVVLLDFKEIDSTTKLNAKTLFDLVKLSFGVVAGAGALVALVVAYRRQRVDEHNAQREATKLHSERFSQAVDKLGSDSPAVRLGGVHALAGLADDAPTRDLRATCINVLCTYLQLPFTPDPGEDPSHQEEHNRYLALRKVRHTILGLISDHYQRPAGTHRSWQGCDLDLSDVTIDCSMDLRGAKFSDCTLKFVGATFSGGTVYFGGAKFSREVNFAGAKFSGGTVFFDGVKFSSYVNFVGASFSGGTVDFVGANFSKALNFGKATFSGGTVNFEGATFSVSSGADFGRATYSGGTVNFSRVLFSNSSVYFGSGTFSGGTVDFTGATFSGGTADFANSSFSGATVNFDGAIFSSTVNFSGGEDYIGGMGSVSRVYYDGATFTDGTVNFTHAEFFDGTVTFARTDDFAGATFSGTIVDFAGASFSGATVDFAGAEFTGGTVNFQTSSGTTPNGLIAAVGTPVPEWVRLPDEW
ncbi:pentapeptide repeat-containing protein [Streptomyces parvus]|uniref:pentapeptide repeat-containing protein n=1 Tax=Streptomyces parvus TaxID=66428 RepID=UPI003405B7C9